MLPVQNFSGRRPSPGIILLHFFPIAGGRKHVTPLISRLITMPPSTSLQFYKAVSYTTHWQ